MAKRISFGMLFIGCIILSGTFSLLLPIRGMVALCEAQTGSQEPRATPGGRKQGQPSPFFSPDRLYAQAAAPQPAGPPPAVSMPQSATPLPPPVPEPRKSQYTLNFDDADIYAIIQTVFGEILRVNYVVDPRVKGRVTFRASAPVDADNILPLMEVILRLNGIGMVEDNSLYRIVPMSDISKEPSPVSYGRDPAKIQPTGKALLQVVPVSYVKSSDALKLITPFLSPNAVVIDVPKGNQIIIVDTDTNVKRMLTLIEIFDNEKLKQRKPQVFVYQVQNSKARDVASLLQQIFTSGKGGAAENVPPSPKASPGSQPTAGQPSSDASAPSPFPISPGAGGESSTVEPVKIIADEVTNTVIILSTAEDFATIAKAIEQIDVIPRQVIIEGMIAIVSLSDNLSLGLAALFKGSHNGNDFSVGINPGALTGVNPAALTQAGFTFLATDAAGLVRGLITALATESKAKVLAAPHILVSDDRDARIQVGQQVPLIASETYGSTTVAPQRNFQYRDIGIILKVRPRINEGGLVALDIAQEVSTYEKITVSGSEQILLNKTEVSTNLVVQDGQTIVIGGLIREDATDTTSGIPFLSKIPFIGWLFGGWTDEKKRQELIILLTPRVIKNQKDAKALSNEFIDRISETSGGRIKGEDLTKEKLPQSQGGANPPDASGKAVPQNPSDVRK